MLPTPSAAAAINTVSVHHRGWRSGVLVWLEGFAEFVEQAAEPVGRALMPVGFAFPGPVPRFLASLRLLARRGLRGLEPDTSAALAVAAAWMSGRASAARSAAPRGVGRMGWRGVEGW